MTVVQVRFVFIPSGVVGVWRVPMIVLVNVAGDRVVVR